MSSDDGVRTEFEIPETQETVKEAIKWGWIPVRPLDGLPSSDSDEDSNVYRWVKKNSLLVQEELLKKSRERQKLDEKYLTKTTPPSPPKFPNPRHIEHYEMFQLSSDEDEKGNILMSSLFLREILQLISGKI